MASSKCPVTTETGTPALTPSLRTPQTRLYNPDADIVSSVALPDNALAAGTAIHTRLDHEISSRENGAGTLFTAQVAQDVVQNGRVIIPAGSVVHGRVIHADYGRRISGHASLRLLADEVMLPDGTHYYMSASPEPDRALHRHQGQRRKARFQTRDNPKDPCRPVRNRRRRRRRYGSVLRWSQSAPLSAQASASASLQRTSW